MPPDPISVIAPDALRDEPMARHSQYGIGGIADAFLKVADVYDIPALLARARDAAVAVTVIGAGSNTLILDGGIRGLVIEITDKAMRVEDESAELNAGCMMPRAALDAARAGAAGLEFGIGIPGTCGASVRGNAGAFGRTIADAMLSCDVALGDGSVRTFTNAECGFDYRTSIFKRELGDAVVMRARFAVSPDDPTATRARTDAIQAQRKATQPYGTRSLGSVFTNPEGDHAGRLIEAAGLRGHRIGGAEISSKHANFIVNVDAATAADVLALVDLAHARVLETAGIDLEREIVIIGDAGGVRAPERMS